MYSSRPTHLTLGMQAAAASAAYAEEGDECNEEKEDKSDHYAVCMPVYICILCVDVLTFASVTASHACVSTYPHSQH